jgi:senataxin
MPDIQENPIFDGILNRISQTYTADDAKLQENVVEECMQYYLSIKDNNDHLFCSSKTSASVLSFLIVVLAGFDIDFNIDQFTPIRSCIDNCTDCLIQYHLNRAEIRKKFILEKKINYNSINLTMEKAAIWEANHLYDKISLSIENKLNNNDLKFLLSKILSECLLNPKILRLNKKLKTYFNHCINFFDSAHNLLISKNLKFYPGLIYLLFSDDENQRNWALSKLPYKTDSIDLKIDENDYYTEIDLNSLFIEEYEIHFFNIQRPDFFNDNNAIQFWTNLIPLLRFTSKNSLYSTLIEPYSSSCYRDDLKIRIVPLYSIFINHIFSYLKTPLPFLLRFLSLSLKKFENSIFDLIKPHNYMSFFDMAFNNPAYKQYLIELKPEIYPKKLLELDSTRDPLFIDLIQWMNSCIEILNDSNNCQFSIAMFGFMADYMKNPNCGNFIGSYVMENMSKQLILKPKNDKLAIELTNKSSARSLLDKKCILVFDALNSNILQLKAIELIKNCLIFDIENYSFYSSKLNNNQYFITPDFNNDLWNLLQVKITSNSNLIVSVFASFENINKVFQIDIAYKRTKLNFEKKENDEFIKKILFTSNKHNKIIEQFSISIENILNKLSEYLTLNQIQLIIDNKISSLGLWSLLLSPVDRIYESSIALMYESFDVDDRLEAFKECLKLNLINTLDSFRISLFNFTSLELFIPTQRIVKILMDFITTLFDPINGIIVSSNIEFSLVLKTSVVQFWIDVWGFLGMIFKNIFDWSINYERLKVTVSKEIFNKITSDLLNFTRDVLDLSLSVLNGLKIITTLITTDDYSKEKIKLIQETLLKPIIVTLPDLFKWLRLSDSALLVRCVGLITKILDLSCNIKMDLKDDLLTILIKLCLRAKKFNNKMNIEQTGELLLRARKINDKLVENVSHQVEEEKRKKSMSPELKSEYQYQSRNGIISGSKQSTLGNYLKPFIREAVPSLDAPKRLSKLELAQLKLNEKRKAVPGEPVKEPAPARPSGFNKKTKAINISDSESDHEYDSDNENNNNALFTKEQVVAKMKKSKAALQSLQAPRFGVSPALNGGKDKNAERIEKKKAEELMRLRLNVDMTPLYKTILSWSYNNNKELPSDYDESKYQSIKDKFDSVSDYQKSFEPLLLLECWQSIQRAKQVGSETPFRMTIGSRSATDTFFDIYASVKKELVNEFRHFGDNDLLVLMIIDNLPSEDEGLGIPKKLVNNCAVNCFAKVREIKNTNGAYSDIKLRVSNDNNMVYKLSSGMEIVGLKVSTMTTLEREFSSLKGLQYYDLNEEIIKATPGPIEKPDESKIMKIKSVYDVNESQARAISGTVQGDGFSLIQGPPGTGKTKTILGVIGYFLTQETNNIHRVLAPGVKADVSTANTVSGSVSNKRKILICAPSNAAVDELVLRIKKGIKNSKGEVFKPNVVRLGKSDAINEQVKDLTLEEQVDALLSKTSKTDDSSIREEHRKCIIERDELRRKLDSNKFSETEIAQTEIRLQEVMTKRRELGKKLDEMREQRAVNYRNREIERRNIQYKILNNAQVVCSTLSGSAHDVLAGMSMTFETVVIDEAAQCIELSAIIPLRYGCKKCIMVGDPNQLPPTVLSQKAASFNYEQSLFVRIQNNHKDSVYLLDVQYRMHPEISKFPSKEFYKSRLRDGPNMKEINKRSWHSIKDYGPYRFFNIRGQQKQNEKTKSLYNTIECKIILEIVEDLYKRFPNCDWSNKIGIISPYKEQVRLLKKTFIDKYGFLITKQIDFNTVDGFQGQEKDIILFSCVRAETHTGVGFLADIRRMNVALTRARASLWVIGSVDALMTNKTWRDLYEDAKERSLVTEAYIGFTSRLETNHRNIQNHGKIKELKDDGEDDEYYPPTDVVERPKSSGFIKPKSSNNDNRITKKRQITTDATSLPQIDVSKLRKLSDHKKPLLIKKSSGKIMKDMKVIRGALNKSNTKSVPTSSGVIMPRRNNNGPPEGMVKISNKKNFAPNRRPN